MRCSLGTRTGEWVHFAGPSRRFPSTSPRRRNVRSLVLSLGQKRLPTARREQTLHAIQDALSEHAIADVRGSSFG